MQNYYSLLYREEEREMLPLCKHLGVGTIPWSPLSRGILSRPRDKGNDSVRSKTDPWMSLVENSELVIVDRYAHVLDSLSYLTHSTAWKN